MKKITKTYLFTATATIFLPLISNAGLDDELASVELKTFKERHYKAGDFKDFTESNHFLDCSEVQKYYDSRHGFRFYDGGGSGGDGIQLVELKADGSLVLSHKGSSSHFQYKSTKDVSLSINSNEDSLTIMRIPHNPQFDKNLESTLFTAGICEVDADGVKYHFPSSLTSQINEGSLNWDNLYSVVYGLGAFSKDDVLTYLDQNPLKISQIFIDAMRANISWAYSDSDREKLGISKENLKIIDKIDYAPRKIKSFSSSFNYESGTYDFRLNNTDEKMSEEETRLRLSYIKTAYDVIIDLIGRGYEQRAKKYFNK